MEKVVEHRLEDDHIWNLQKSVEREVNSFITFTQNNTQVFIRVLSCIGFSFAGFTGGAEFNLLHFSKSPFNKNALINYK